ncbi:MAG: hypothetical protein SFW09_20285 [Hyphomicrobiaceae bacterium]|nr:hypothetical protein [Hyphomicrobiaceae bacterium]
MWAPVSLPLVLALSAVGAADGFAQACSRADFEAAVGAAAEALRGLNQTNKPGFQAKLRLLKAKRNWTHDQFLAEAAPIVQDVTITGYDERSAEFLARIEQLGAEGTSAANPDCDRLREVRESMRALVEVQKAKWAYMFGKIEAELAK